MAEEMEKRDLIAVCKAELKKVDNSLEGGSRREESRMRRKSLSGIQGRTVRLPQEEVSQGSKFNSDMLDLRVPL